MYDCFALLLSILVSIVVVCIVSILYLYIPSPPPNKKAMDKIKQLERETIKNAFIERRDALIFTYDNLNNLNLEIVKALGKDKIDKEKKLILEELRELSSLADTHKNKIIELKDLLDLNEEHYKESICDKKEYDRVKSRYLERIEALQLEISILEEIDFCKF